MTFLHRLALALTPHIRHDITTPEDAARAVLEAMREPTEGMLAAGDAVVDTWDYGHTIATSELVQAFTAMVEAALGEATHA